MHTESLYSRIENSISSFPSIPSTVAEVMRVVNNAESSANDLTRAILPDQSMCVAILKIANSALYGRPKKVSSIETAIMVLGFSEVQNIVLSRAMLKNFSEIFERNNKIIEAFWEHSFTAALAARLIAEHFNITEPSRFFIGGLIHDIGKLAMHLTIPQEYSLEQWLSGFMGQEKLAEEQQIFGITHPEVAGRLLRLWHFPDAMSDAIEHHHQPEILPHNQGFALILQLADALSYLCNKDKDVHEALDIVDEILKILPGLDKTWQKYKLPWERIRLEMWYNWLLIEKEHGSSVLSILASK